jgi:AcrR family transcriptional regulator
MPGTTSSTGADRRREGRARPIGATTRHDVLVAALRLIDDDGIEALSMRRLGRALGRDPMRLYRYAESKDDLLDGVVELVLNEWEVPAAASAQAWPEVLRTSAHSYRRIALNHPHVVPLIVTRPLESLLELLIGAGFDARGALHAFRHYMGFLQGHVLTELQERVHDPEETDTTLRLGLYRLPPKEFPRLRSLADDLGAYDGAGELDHGLDIVLEGLRRRS